MTKKVNNTTPTDVAYAATKGGLGAIPIIGALAAEIFNLVVTPPLEKRRAEWMNDVAERLKKLEEDGVIDIQSLKDDEQFIDVVLQTTTYALKTSEKEKIAAFKNALINTALDDSPDLTKTQIFLSQLDKFTTWHIRILDFIDSPQNWFKKANINPPNYMMGSLSAVILDAFPELRGKDALLDVIWEDLKIAGFHSTTGLKTMMTGSGTLADRTTSFGKEFLDFIRFEE